MTDDISPSRARLAALHGTAVQQDSTLFVQPIYGKRGTRAIAQQALQAIAVVCRYAYPRVLSQTARLLQEFHFDMVQQRLRQMAAQQGWEITP